MKCQASFSSQDYRRKIVDPVVLTTSSQESLSIVISITNKCISPESSSIPSVEDVLWNLQYAAQVQATADADQKSDTSQTELQSRWASVFAHLLRGEMYWLQSMITRTFYLL